MACLREIQLPTSRVSKQLTWAAVAVAAAGVWMQVVEEKVAVGWAVECMAERDRAVEGVAERAWAAQGWVEPG